MSFAALRAPVRRAVVSATPRASARARTTFRKYSTAPTPPPAKSNNAWLFAGLGVALAGAGFYVYSSQSDSARAAGTAVKSTAQAAKSKANFVPTKEDYQKVCENFGLFLGLSRLPNISKGLQQDCFYS